MMSMFVLVCLIFLMNCDVVFDDCVSECILLMFDYDFDSIMALCVYDC